MNRPIVVCLLAALFSGCGSAGRQETRAREEIARGRLGQTLTAVPGDGSRFTVLRLRLVSVDPDAPPSDRAAAAAALPQGSKGARYAWARLTLAARSSGPSPGPLSGRSFQVIDGKGRRYRGVDATPRAVFASPVTNRPFPVGAQLRGTVAVPLPPGARPVKVRYASIRGGGQAEWSLPG